MSYMDDTIFRNFMHEYLLTDDQLQEIYTRFMAEISKGLGRDTNKNADTKCYITYVQDLPTGEEIGKYLALDLGGSNFRVLLVTLQGAHQAELDSVVFPIPGDIMVSTATKLFDHIAHCLAEFVVSHNLQEDLLPLGFTFSFPCVQMGLTKALLVRWTKGFNVSGVVNEDIGRLLQDAIRRRGDTKIDVMAILNDTIGTLMSCAHRTSGCRIGLIVGTGCNACYVERTENVDLLEPEYKKKPFVVINVEWGAFGDRGCLEFIRTDFDRILDRNSVNKGAQIFEKMLAGMYLGELVRLTLLRATRENLIFNSCTVRAKILNTLENCKNLITTQHVSEIESEAPSAMNKTKLILQKLLCLKSVPEDDCLKVKFICECVSRRSGLLVGVTLSGLINKMGEPKVVVGVDGSVYRLHPRYDSYMREGMEKFVDPGVSFDITLSEDGSGRGAALVAAVAANN